MNVLLTIYRLPFAHQKPSSVGFRSPGAAEAPPAEFHDSDEVVVIEAEKKQTSRSPAAAASLQSPGSNATQVGRCPSAESSENTKFVHRG